MVAVAVSPAEAVAVASANSLDTTTNRPNMKAVNNLTLFFVLLFSLHSNAQISEPAPCGPVPSENQLRWQDMEMYAFIHYSMNTYTDEEWGFGNERLELFNPQNLDCRQWARVCKQAGMRGIIFTAKHHCGFCMWPSKYWHPAR